MTERQYVYVVTLPSDEHEELHVFGDMESACKVRDAIEGAIMREEPVLGDSYADEVLAGERDGEEDDDRAAFRGRQCTHCNDYVDEDPDARIVDTGNGETVAECGTCAL